MEKGRGLQYEIRRGSWKVILIKGKGAKLLNGGIGWDWEDEKKVSMRQEKAPFSQKSLTMLDLKSGELDALLERENIGTLQGFNSVKRGRQRKGALQRRVREVN